MPGLQAHAQSRLHRPYVNWFSIGVDILSQHSSIWIPLEAVYKSAHFGPIRHVADIAMVSIERVPCIYISDFFSVLVHVLWCKRQECCKGLRFVAAE